MATWFLVCLVAIGHGQAFAEDRALKLYNIHTQEKATIVFKRNGVYDQAGLQQINRFLRDWRKDAPTAMDPLLIDLVWDAYRQSGSHDYIHVVCGYRSPETNNMLRRRSKGVAENSLHMSGKALDFYIPGVDLAKLRVIGLKMQLGGVGFYPASGAPFVHLDTGNVRHWPRMSRQQLVSVFPNGGTLHVPSDGKPLPGYNQALAAYQARKASGGAIAVASAAPAADTRAAPLVVAAIDPDERDDNITASTPAPVLAPRRAVAVASYSTAPTPLPRLAPKRAEPVVAAAGAAGLVAPAPSRGLDFNTVATAASSALTPGFDFGSPQNWSAPAVPAALAAAMAERDRTRLGASVPIPPTAVVATIDVSRPLRAAAITTAVLRTSDDATGTIPQVLAYAPIDAFRGSPPLPAKLTAAGVPLPQPSPRRGGASASPAMAARSIMPAPRMHAPALMMTTLDTQGLRLWIGPGSTRQKSYALLTMPDFSQAAGLFSKPEMTFGAGFGRTAYGGLRTDRFAGSLVVQPAVVDLTLTPLVTASR